jgi:molybdopterin molybdotransferase
VVPVEETEPAGSAGVRVLVAPRPGAYVRDRGSDLAVGDEAIAPATVLGPGHLGVAASVGVSSVSVVRRPRVGILSTGSELVEAGGSLGPGKIFDSNRVALAACCADSGMEVEDLGIVADTEEGLEQALLAAAARCDVILTSGGVSVGDLDFTKAVLLRLGGPKAAWLQVAIRPAKPFAFGLIGGVPVFGLAGNPVSSMVGFECLVRPALLKMAGHRDIYRPTVLARAEEAFGRRRDGRLYLVRVVARRDESGTLSIRSAGGQSSHQLLAMANANALALLPDGEGFGAGDHIPTILISGEIESPSMA